MHAYSFDVQIVMNADGGWDFVVAQEFNGGDTEVIAYGVADSFQEAVDCAGEGIREVF